MLLVDSDPTFRAGLARAIQAAKTLAVVGQVGSAEELFNFNNEGIPGAEIALVEIDLPDQSGFEVCQRLLVANPKWKVVLLAYADWDIHLLAAHTLHAGGLLLRSQATPALITALEQAASGPVFSAEQMRRIQTWKETTRPAQRTSAPGMAGAATAGAREKQPGNCRAVEEDPESMVEKHVSSLLQKLELVSRVAMINFIHANHLEELGKLPHGEQFLMMLAN